MLVSLCLFAIASSTLAIQLENNSYKDVIIAINRDVEEDASLLQAIKDLVTDASPVLYHATRKRAYLGEVTIVIPDTWEDKPDYLAATTRETYRSAKVRINPPIVIKGREENYAFVQTIRRCGAQGIFMHITPKRITDPLWRYASPPHKMFIHGWGHLRWGIFDEYYRKSFYGLDFDGKPARCVKKVGVTQLSNKNWKYNTSGISASIMWRHFDNNVVEFCDDSDNATVKHYRKAKNDQNYVCDMRSSWEMMRETDDFRNGRNPPRDVADIRPTIRVVRKKTVSAIVLVLDISNNMTLNHRLTNLRQAMKSYINGITTGSYVGIVHFNNTAIVKKDLTKIENPGSRNILSKSLPAQNDLGAEASIGGAILKALDILSVANCARKQLLIVSGGVETHAPYIMDPNVQQSIENSRVQIHTIAVGEQADENLLSLADKTGGMAFFHEENSNELSGMQEAVSAVREYESNEDDRIYQVNRQTMTVLEKSTSMATVDFDGGIGHGTVFNFFWTSRKFRVKNLRLSVRSPRGTVYKYRRSRGLIYCDTVDMMCTLKVAGTVKPGRWTIKVQIRGKTPLLLTWEVFSHQQQKSTKPITLETHISHSQVTFPQTTTITASLTKGSQPVIDAFISAVITRPSGDPVVIHLHDNGAGADLLAFDGLYSATFTQFSGTGFYNVKVIASQDYTNNYNFTVNSQDMDIKLKSKRARLGTRYVSDDFMPDDSNFDTLSEPPVEKMGGILPRFTRIQSPGMFRVNEYRSNEDAIPPSQIMDLSGRVVDGYKAELTWTAPGDDMDNGEASSYNVRFSTNFDDLVDNFSRQHELIPRNVLSPGFSMSKPKMSGLKETLRFMSPVKAGMVFVAVKTSDSSGQWSGLSNVVHLEFRQPTTQTCNCSVKTSLETAICKDDFLMIGTVDTVTDKNILFRGAEFLKAKFPWPPFLITQVTRVVTRTNTGCLCPLMPQPGQTYLMSGKLGSILQYTEKSYLQLTSNNMAQIRERVKNILMTC